MLLDTHIWIWLMAGSPRLEHAKCLTQIGKAAENAQVLISAISVWELGMLVKKKRLQLLIPTTDWVKNALSAPGITLAPLTPESTLESTLESTTLPGEFDGDPADNIIIATTRKAHATLITRDERILAYGEEGYVRVIKA